MRNIAVSIVVLAGAILWAVSGLSPHEGNVTFGTVGGVILCVLGLFMLFNVTGNDPK